MADGHQDVAANANTAYEPSDWPLDRVAWTFAASLATLVLGVGTMIWAFPGTLSDVNRKLTVEPPPPRLQVDPAADLVKLRTEKEKELNSYYWIDKQKGVVHIPIEQAMQKLVKSGLDGFPKAQP